MSENQNIIQKKPTIHHTKKTTKTHITTNLPALKMVNS